MVLRVRRYGNRKQLLSRRSRIAAYKTGPATWL
jgi:hypothetical protein